MGNSKHRFSIIIPTYRSKQLKNSLKAIANLNDIELVQDVLVVGLQDSTEFPTVPRLRYIEILDTPTPAHNRNIGVQEAQADWICFIDSDCSPEPDWLEQIRSAIQKDTVAVAGAVKIPDNMSYWGICNHLFGFEYQAVELAGPDEVPYAATLNFSIRRDVFLALGGFDEDFQTAGGEDRDFGWRLKQAGYRIWSEPAAQVLHNHTRQDFPSALKHVYHYGCVAAQFRQKYAQLNNRKWHTFRTIARIPFIGETAGIIRSILRNLTRFITQSKYRKQAIFIPGIILFYPIF